MSSVSSKRWYENKLLEEFEPVGKEKLFWLIDNAIGEVIDIPPIKYCIYQRFFKAEWLLFNWGSIYVKVVRSFKGLSVTLEDENTHPQFLTVPDVKNLFS